MFPTLLPGDRVVLGDCSSLSTGDIVGFIDSSGDKTLHRVLGFCPTTGDYLTAGDGNSSSDSPVPKRAVIGLVLCVQRQLLGVCVPLPSLLWRRPLVGGVASGLLRRIVETVLRKVPGTIDV